MKDEDIQNNVSGIDYLYMREFWFHVLFAMVISVHVLNDYVKCFQRKCKMPFQQYIQITNQVQM